MKITKSDFGVINGTTVNSFTLKNNRGIEVSCIDFGCIITKILTPDARGKVENIVLGYENILDYQRNSNYFGAIIGRVAGRVRNGVFHLNGIDYHIEKNDAGNHLHGGPNGFHNVFWTAEMFQTSEGVGVDFYYESPDGQGGFPGTLRTKVTYVLSDNNELTIFYTGISDRDTIVNLTNHTYFNLSGNLKNNVLNHGLKLKSDRFLELGSDLLPTGRMVEVDQTPFDFREEKKLLQGANSSVEQNLIAGNGYDHPFMLNDNHNEEIVLRDIGSGRRMIIETDAPCVVLYTGNQLSNNFNIGPVRSEKYLGVCLETQSPPDAVNHEEFPSIVIEKGKEFKTKTTYRFIADGNQ